MDANTPTIRSRAAALLGLHSWSGIVLGMLLYAVIFTGTVAVIADEIGEWSNSNARQDLLVNADKDALLAPLLAKTPAEYHDEVTLYEGHRGELVFFFHTHKTNPNSGMMDDYGTEYRVKPNGELVSERTGFGSDLYATDEGNALSRFLVAIHTELHIPSPWGLLLTGILGLAMLVAAVSGFMMHRHLFTDIFTIRKQRDGKSLTRDAHTVAGTWSIPFAILLAFTGSFFSFATSFGLPAMAMVAFGGDQEAMMYTLVGEQQNKSETPLASSSLNSMLADANERQGAAPTFVAISHINTESASLIAYFMPTNGGVGLDQLVYDASSGEFEEYKPQVGTKPSVGSAVLSLMFPIHFGTFAGLLSKLIWISLGIAASYVTVTGLRLYAHRKEKPTSEWRWFTRMCHWGFTGLPICSLASAAGFFLSGVLGASESVWTPLSFVIAAGIVSALSLIIKNVNLLRTVFIALNGLFCILLPLLRMLVTNVGWSNAIAYDMEAVLLIDTGLFICGAVCMYMLIARPVKKAANQAKEGKVSAPPELAIKGVAK